MTTACSILPSAADFREMEEMVLSTFLRTDVFQIHEPGGSWPGSDEIWTGCITINGAFSGVITLSCTKTFARQTCIQLIAAADGKVTDEMARDMLAELTNVVGGNLKSLFSMLADSACQLSLPIVASGYVEVPDAAAVSNTWYACQQHRIVITVFEAAEPALKLPGRTLPGAQK